MLSRNRIATLASLAALPLLAAWPLLRYGPPLQADAITDGPNHLYRFALLDWHVQHGDLYPRWFADLHYGFGAPVLNFYAPLSYYILLALHGILPSFPAAFLLGFVLSFPVAVCGAYLWARDQFESPLAGLTAASAYSLTPYTYFSIMDRAAHPELWGLAIAPWLFWLALRAVRQPARATQIALTLTYAALILTHNLSALLFTPILLAYVLLLLWPEWRAFAPIGVSFAHAALIAAFFLLPFLMESQYVQLQRAGLYDYAANFGSIGDLFSPPVPFDPRHVTHPRPISVPWPQLMLAASAVAAVVRSRPRPGWAPTVLAFALFAALLIFMNAPASIPLWNILPLAKQIQFPFRLLGPTMLLLAWLCGACVACLPALSLQRLFAPSSIAAFFFFTLTWTFHAPFDRFPDDIRPADIIRGEIAYPSRLGTTNLQEFLPRWVNELPSPDAVLPKYADSPIPSRVAELPVGVKIIDERNALNAIGLEYESTSDFALTFNIFYFPGWTATLDGQLTPIRPAGQRGLIALDLPSGQHTLYLSLRPTAPQIVANIASLMALLALFIPLLRGSAGRLQRKDNAKVSAPLSPVVTFLLLALLAFRILADRVETPFNRTLLGHLPNPLAVNFGDQLALIGFDLPRGASLTSGDTLPVNLYWQAVTPLTTDYRTTVQLVDQRGNHFGQSDSQHPAGVPTSRWQTDQYARDEHQLQSLSGAPPGEYHLLVGVYALTDGGVKSLNMLADGSPTGPEYDLGVVTVIRAAPQAPGPLRIAESSVAIPTVGVGDRLPFTIAFVSGDSVSPGLTAELQFIGSNGQSIFSTRFAPAGPDYPSEQWTPRELIRYPHSVDLPPDLPAGPVHLTLTFIHPDGSPAAQSFELGAATITVPERSFAVPAMSHHVDHDFGAAIRLLGYDLTPETVTLYWQSLQPVSTRLTVFVHNFDASGNFIGGQDTPPPRPTTSWLPGEVITDVRQFSLDKHFEIGLYDSVTGDRFGEPFSNQP